MAGKTTLAQAMLREELRCRKTQTLSIAGGFIIDTPGEYLERGGLRGALSAAEIEAAKGRLARAGVKRVFVTSACTGAGMAEFLDFIDSSERNEVG